MNTLFTIVIPCYNEAARLKADEYIAFLIIHEHIGFIFVDDGSTDNTVEIIKHIQSKVPGQVKLLILPSNVGKAEAVRQGILASLKTPTGYVGFWDADLATPLSEIIRFVAILTSKESREMVCGARISRLGADIRRHWYRHYSGRFIATLISVLLRLPTYDTQCGAKLLKRHLAEKIFVDPFSSPWLFDVELIARIIGLNGRRKTLEIIYELPLKKWHDIKTSKISLSYLPQIPIEIFKIYYRYKKQLNQP